MVTVSKDRYDVHKPAQIQWKIQNNVYVLLLFFFFIDFEFFGSRSFLQSYENVTQICKVNYAFYNTETRVNTLYAEKPENSIYLITKTFLLLWYTMTRLLPNTYIFLSSVLHFALFTERNYQVFDMETVVLKSNIIKTIWHET